ncbi:MAG: elongation factor G [Planctomycetota bacterium]
MSATSAEGTSDGSPLSRVRNIGIAAHIDAGKTTTTERVLFYAGRTHKVGEVDDGTTTTDFDEQEQQRGITIFSAAVTLPWKDHQINLIDTPGHVDFTAEVERSLRVLDGAVVVFDSKEGVEAQSETVWRQAMKYHVPCLCFLNKMDKIGADFYESLLSIEKRLESHPVAIQLPIGAEGTFEGLIDLVTMKAYRFAGDHGVHVEEYEIPPAMVADAKQWRHTLEEKVAELDDELMHKYLEEQPLTECEIKRVLRQATITGRMNPVICGSSLKNIGVQKMIDAVVDYLPSPLERPPIDGVRSLKDLTVVHRKPRRDEPFSALVFKIVAEKPLDLYYIRVYSGVMKSSMRSYNSNTGEKENISRMFRMFAKRREQLDEAGPGEIVACVGLKDALTGHTLCDAKDQVVLERIEFPTPVISVSVEPKNSKDKETLIETLGKMARQDPTFRHSFNAETGQTIISGMGELHLEVLIYKLDKDFRVPVIVGKPLVAYREAITQRAEAEGRFIRQTGGHGQYAVVRLRVEPFKPAKGEEAFSFSNEIKGGALRAEFVHAVERGAKECLSMGVLAGYELLNVHVTLLEGKEHPVDSSDMAFENAARMAFEEACKHAGPVMLEPIMKLVVTVPDDYFGIVSGDLSARRGLIQDTEMRKNHRAITAHVPLSEMFQYSTHVRTLTQGRANWAMEPHSYAAMPLNLQKELLRKHGYGD